MKALIALDTEDFISDTTPDAQLWWAKELHKLGVKATFQMVGEMTRKLINVGRQDVIDAIKKHDIGYHTNYHSLHPTQAEGIDGMNLADSIKWLLDREESGFEIVKKTFGVNPFSFTSAGTSWTPAKLIVNGLHDVKVSFVSPYSKRYNPYWYCGQLVVHYTLGFDKLFPPESSVEQFIAIYEKEKKLCKAVNGIFAFYTHPGRICTAQHWDVAYKHGANPSISECPMPPKWPEGHAEIVKERLHEVFQYLKSDSELEFVSVQDVYKENISTKYDLNDILEDLGLSKKNVFSIPLRERSPKDLFAGEPMDVKYKNWIPHKPDFEPQSIFDQIKGLAWTTRLGK